MMLIDSNNNVVTDFMLSTRFRVYRHIILQFIIIIITANMCLDLSMKPFQDMRAILGWIGYYSIINIIVYSNMYVLVPRYLQKNKFLKYLIGVSFLIIISLFFVVGLQRVLYRQSELMEMDILFVILNFFSSVFTVGLLIAGTSTFSLFRHWVGYNQRIDELESITLHSELKQLKRQINPHFLFNMLNNANVLIKKNPEEASRLLFKLEDLLRYQINDSSKENVALSSDIRFLNDFLNLEKIRRDKFDYVIAKEGDIDEVYLPPLLFISFVENAVKHNSDSENKSYVYLYFKVWNNELTFQCINSKPAISQDKNRVGGLGLNNIKRRLELLYPRKHSLEIEEDETKYKVTLYLKL